MILTQNLINGAKKILSYEGVEGLPKQIGKMPFYVAGTTDKTILGHGTILHDDKEYKIGTQMTEQEQ